MSSLTFSNLEMSYKACYEIMKDKAVNFFHAFKFMDTSRFQAITGVYAFCRYVDDIADENEEESIEEKFRKLDEITKIVNTIDLKHEEFSRNHIWFTAFRKAVIDFNISKTSLLDQIKGQRSDLSFESINSKEDLIEYSTLVAGSVGRMLMPMLSKVSDDEAMSICNSLGVAMQITNILRDIGEDYRDRNRIYLPKDLMDTFNVSESNIAQLSDLNSKVDISENIIEMWETLANEAESYYDDFIKNINIFNVDARLPLLLACENYRAILEAVRKENYNCFTKRCYTNKIKRVEILHRVKSMLKNVDVR